MLNRTVFDSTRVHLESVSCMYIYNMHVHMAMSVREDISSRHELKTTAEIWLVVVGSEWEAYVSRRGPSCPAARVPPMFRELAGVVPCPSSVLSAQP
jgi:hypothetical protein